MTRGTGPDSRRWAAKLIVLWPVFVTVGYPAFAFAFGVHGRYAFGLAMVGGATLVFARFGFLGLATTRCVDCDGPTAVGRLYCPHCGSLHSRVYAPGLQAFAAGAVLPIWFLIAESFIVTLVGALVPFVPTVGPLAEFYRAFAFTGDVSIVRVLVASAVVPFVVTTVVRLVLRTSEEIVTQQADTS